MGYPSRICLAVLLGCAVPADAFAQAPTLPVPISQPKPEYPAAMRYFGQEAKVEVEFLLNDKGEVREAVVKNPAQVRPEFEAAALEGLYLWKFKPATRLGKAVPVRMAIEIVFRLSDAPQHSLVMGKPPKNAPPEYQFDTAPKGVNISSPVYPYDLALKGTKGSATIHFVVNRQGRTTDIRVEAATNPEFAASAAAMVATWTFTPALKDGQPCLAAVSFKQEFNTSVNGKIFSESTARLMGLLKKSPDKFVRDMSTLDKMPARRSTPPVVLPAAMAAARTPGTAEIEFIIDRSGRAQLPRVVSASSAEYGWAAATAVGSWYFEAPKMKGEPVDVVIRVPVNTR